MPFNFLKKTKKAGSDSLKINKRAGNVSGSLTAIRFRDKDTRQIIIYIPALELTGYGATTEKAELMINFSMEDYFEYLLSMPSKKINAELEGLGWKHNAYKNKEYSKSYVDVNGELKNFNAVADTVEQLTLVKAE
jgi:hypothetical protein